MTFPGLSFTLLKFSLARGNRKVAQPSRVHVALATDDVYLDKLKHKGVIAQTWTEGIEIQPG